MDDLTGLYTSFNGRINRARYWLGTFILAIPTILTLLVVGALLGVSILAPDFRFKLISLFLAALLLYPSAALMVKRLNDRDRPAWLAGLFLAPTLIRGFTDVIGMTGNRLAPNFLDVLLGLLAFVINIWAFVELGCLRGTVGANQHGSDRLSESLV
jgi:uncharacterized membrane protein YhaH (DUF805 family)